MRGQKVKRKETIDLQGAFLPTEITVDITGTKQGTVTAAVNGKAVAISDGKLTVSRHDNVTMAATPNENQRLVAWTLDNVNKGNSSMVLNLTDVTAAHTIAAEFGSTQSVTLTVRVDGGSSVITQLGYGGALQTVDATNCYRADVGQTVKVTADYRHGEKRPAGYRPDGGIYAVQDRAGRAESGP